MERFPHQISIGTIDDMTQSVVFIVREHLCLGGDIYRRDQFTENTNGPYQTVLAKHNHHTRTLEPSTNFFHSLVCGYVRRRHQAAWIVKSQICIFSVSLRSSERAIHISPKRGMVRVPSKQFAVNIIS